jgi:hypothetical protein
MMISFKVRKVVLPDKEYVRHPLKFSPALWMLRGDAWIIGVRQEEQKAFVFRREILG